MGVPKWGSQGLGEPEGGLPEVEHPVGSVVKEDRHSSEETLRESNLMGTGRTHNDQNGREKLPRPGTGCAVRKQVQWLQGTMQSVPVGVGTDLCHMQSVISKDCQRRWTDGMITCEATREQFKIANDDGLHSGFLTV